MFKYNGKSYKELNGHQKIAMRNIKGVFDWYVGEEYNAYQDGYEYSDEHELFTQIKDSMYRDNAMTSGNIFYDRAPKEMKFAGTEFCNTYLNYLWNTDSDIKEMYNK